MDAIGNVTYPLCIYTTAQAEGARRVIATWNHDTSAIDITPARMRSIVQCQIVWVDNRANVTPHMAETCKYNFPMFCIWRCAAWASWRSAINCN